MRITSTKGGTMTLTYEITHAVASVEDVSIEVAPKSEMTLQSTTTDPKTGEVASRYVLASGDVNHPADITYRSALQTRGGALIRRITVTFSTWATSTDSVTGIVVYKPVQASFSMNIPVDMTTELADIDDFLGTTFSFLYASVSVKVRNTGYLQKLLYGITQVV